MKTRIGSTREIGGRYDKALSRHRNTNPIAPGQSDILPWTLYDRVVTAAAANTATQYVFFNQPIGAAGKTKEDTNMEQVMRLPAPQWFNTYSIGFYFDSEMIKVDIDSFLKDYYFEFWVGTKPYLEGPLQFAPAGAGLYGATTRNNEGGFANGMPVGGNQYDLRLPAGVGNSDGATGVTILEGQTFKVNVIGTAFALAAAAAPGNGIGLNLMCRLDGILSRGVQ